MPAAMTSVAPTPLRERTCGALAAFLLGCRRRLWRCTGVGRSDWRQSIPAPAASSTTGQTMASENQIPSARMVSRKASVTQAHPDGDLDRGAAARQAPRPRGRAAVGHAVVGGHEHPCEPVDHDPHAARGRRRDEDDAHDERVDAQVAADPGAHARDELVRRVSAQRLAARRGGLGGAHVAVDHASRRGPSVAARQPGGEQDVAEQEARERSEGREAEVDRVRARRPSARRRRRRGRRRRRRPGGRGGGRSCARLVARRAGPVLVLVVMDDEGADPDVAVDHDARRALPARCARRSSRRRCRRCCGRRRTCRRCRRGWRSTRTRRAGRAARLRRRRDGS